MWYYSIGFSRFFKESQKNHWYLLETFYNLKKIYWYSKTHEFLVIIFLDWFLGLFTINYKCHTHQTISPKTLILFNSHSLIVDFSHNYFSLTFFFIPVANELASRFLDFYHIFFFTECVHIFLFFTILLFVLIFIYNSRSESTLPKMACM